MSWLNANEYALMEAAARDRVEDLRAAVDAPITRAETCEERPRDPRACPYRPGQLAPCLPG
jgi:hypothetical protein